MYLMLLQGHWSANVVSLNQGIQELHFSKFMPLDEQQVQQLILGGAGGGVGGGLGAGYAADQVQGCAATVGSLGTGGDMKIAGMWGGLLSC
jgi:hypothetical protein